MKRFTNILRYLLNTLFFLSVAGAVAVYVLVHFGLLAKMTNEEVTPILSEKLNTKVEIGEVEINWLNQLALNDVVIYDQQDDTLLYVRRAMVAYELLPMLEKKLVISTVQLIEFDIRIRQESLEAEPNFKFIVDALAPRKNKKRKFINDFSLRTLHLRRGSLSYNLGNNTQKLSFPNYKNLQFTDITASLQVEVSHITGLDVYAKRLSLKEQSGLSLEGKAELHDDSLQLHLKQLLLDCKLPAYVDVNGEALLSLNHLDEARYRLNIVNSEMTPQTVRRLAKTYDLKLPQIAELWSDSLEKVTVKGSFEGVGWNDIALDGVLKTLGKINADAKIYATYKGLEPEPVFVKTDANIKSFPFKRHTYRNIRLLATTNGKDIRGSFSSADPLCSLKGKAEVNLRGQTNHITFDSDLLNLNPYALHYANWENLEGLNLQGHASGSFTLQRGEWPVGSAQLDSLTLTTATDTLCYDSIHLDLQREQDIWFGNIEAPFMHLTTTQTEADLKLPASQELSHLLKLPAYISEETHITAQWDSANCQLTIDGDIPEMKTDDGTITALFKAEGTTKAHSPIPEQIRTQLAFDYITKKHLLSTAMVTHIKPTPLYIEIETGEISVDGHPFGTEGTVLSQLDNGTYSLTNLSFRNGEQELSVNGYYRDATDLQAGIHLNDLKIDFLLDMLGREYLNFGGHASGDITLSSDSDLYLKTENLLIRDFTYMDCILGDNTLSGNYNLNTRDLYVDVDIEDENRHSYANGDIAIGLPGVKASMDLNFDFDKLPIDFCSYWVGGFIHDLHGKASGKARLFGASDQLNILGHPYFEANFTNNIVGSRFYLNDSIHFETAETLADGRIRIDHVRLTDKYGQEGFVDGLVKHTYLGKYYYDIDIDIPTTGNGFLVYDFPNQRPGDLYWGQLYGKGQANLQGSTVNAHHRISVKMEPAGKSVLYLSPGEQSFSDNGYSFLTFHDKTAETELMGDMEMLSHVRTNNKEVKQETTIEADLQIHANEHCLVNMQMDPLAEDRLLCRGEGDINLRYQTNHDISILGNYNINQGSYTITMKGDVMSKSFQLRKGSRVNFSGVPSEAELNLNAIYSIPSANLKDLDESFVTAANLSRTTLPVDCKLYVNGMISSPQISFDLEVKNVSDDVQALVHNIIGTPEMLNREVFYLLLFGRFYTPEYASTSSNNTSNGLSSFASATLTSQLNNLLGHMSDNFSLGTNIHSDKGDFSDMEMDVTLQTRLFSDRLLLSGNLSYRDPANRVGLDNNSNSFIGDFDVEYLINSAGTLRAKAYSHYNERYYNINNSLTTQGIGIVMRKDFTSLKEFLPWQPKKTK